MTRRFVVAVCAAVLAGAASAALADPRDPLEFVNRGVDALNHRVDEAALKPLAKSYKRAVPSLVRSGVSNFFANLDDAWSAANSMSQLKPADAAQNAMRFAVNTVFGFGGVLDIATDAGIERHKEDFGATLAHWGVPAGRCRSCCRSWGPRPCVTLRPFPWTGQAIRWAMCRPRPNATRLPRPRRSTCAQAAAHRCGARPGVGPLRLHA